MFAPLAIAIDVLDASSDTTATAAMVYFAARAAHYGIYTFGVPVLRTIAFFAAWASQVVLALSLFGVV